MSAEDAMKALRARADKALLDNTNHAALVEEVYRYVLPLRRPTTHANDKGAPRFSEIFDSTAPRAAFRFAGRLQSEFTPPFQTFFELEMGPLVPEGDGKKFDNEMLASVSRITLAQIHASNFDVASHEAYLDLFAGDLAILMLETGDRSNPTHYLTVPSTEVAIRLDGFGRRAGIYWRRKFTYGDLPYLWQTVNIDRDTQEKVEKSPDEELDVTQASEYDAKAKRWTFTAFHAGSKSPLYEQPDMPYCNWLTCAFWKVPGESKGRGPGMVGLGATKVANKVQEFSLKNAAFQTLGLWMYRDDGTFRLANAPIMPGAFWKVASTGGPFGPSVQKLPVAERFDVSMFVLNELQMQIKQAMLDDTLPPDTGAVRSATEIVERMKRLAADWAGAYSRLQRDFLRPLIEWNIWVASRNGTLPAAFKIDEVLVKLKIISPVARGDQAQSVESEVKAIELIKTLFGDQVMMLTAKVEAIAPSWMRKLGASESNIRSEGEQKALQQAIAGILAAQQQAAQQGAQAA